LDLKFALRLIRQSGELQIQHTRRTGDLIASMASWIYISPRISIEALMQISKWGNSLAVRIPAAVADALDLKAGDEIEIDVVGGRRFEVAQSPGREELLARLRKYRGLMPAGFRFDRLEANERG